MGPVILAILLSGAALAVVPATVWVVGVFSGWRELARRFPTTPPPPVGPGARRGRFGSIGFGAGGYNGCVVWAADDEYLHLALWPVFAVAGHPPMSIPWSAVEFGGRSFGAVRVTIEGRVRWRLPMAMVEGELAVRKAIGAGEDEGSGHAA